MQYRRYLLGVLVAIQAWNYMDGLALGLVLQSIKTDLRLSDTQLGLLSGIAFWLFYSIMGIPIARWADRGNRVTIISVTLAVWSLLVTLYGLAQNFTQLLLIRIGVAVGEAGCVPPAHSLIADYFPRSQRPRAVAVYMLGGPLSMALGYIVAGWVNEAYGWRLTFAVLGIPGLLLAAIARWTLREPRQASTAPRATQVARERPGTRDLSAGGMELPLRSVCVLLWRMPTFRHLLIYFCIGSFFVAGILQWQPAFFARSYGIGSRTLGTWFSLVYGIGGVIGSYCSGHLAARMAPGRESRQLRWMAVVIFALAVVSVLIYTARLEYVAFSWMALAAIGGAATNGPVFAAIQTLVPERTRAIAVSLIYLCANLIGTGFGPLAAGVLSDGFQPWVGNESLRYALLVLSPGYAFAAWHLWLAARTVEEDIASTEVSAAALDPLCDAVVKGKAS